MDGRPGGHRLAGRGVPMTDRRNPHPRPPERLSTATTAVPRGTLYCEASAREEGAPASEVSWQLRKGDLASQFVSG